MLRARQYAEAADRISAKWCGRAQSCYQPMGDLHSALRSHAGEVMDYTRELDLATAVAASAMSQDGVEFTREIFASHPGQDVIVIRLTASKPAAIHFRAILSSVHPTARTAALGTQEIVHDRAGAGYCAAPNARMGGAARRPVEVPGDLGQGRQAPPHRASQCCTARRWTATACVSRRGCAPSQATGGVAPGRRPAESQGATEVLLLLVGGDQLQRLRQEPQPAGRGAVAACRGRTLPRRAQEAITALREAHVADYRKLFDRVSPRPRHATGAEPPAHRRTHRAIRQRRDPALAALYFQFGRYLMIAGSRPGGQPLNLQGIWNPT